jgi:hypothetical protein
MTGASQVLILKIKHVQSRKSTNLEGKGRNTKRGPTSKGKITPKSERAQIPSLGLKPLSVKQIREGEGKEL